MDAATYKRIENAVFTFVTDHPNLSRDDIQKRMIGFNPSTIRVALHRLKSKALIDGYYERHADGKLIEHFRPARLDHK
jgi:hypothetical protein